MRLREVVLCDFGGKTFLCTVRASVRKVWPHGVADPLTGEPAASLTSIPPEPLAVVLELRDGDRAVGSVSLRKHAGRDYWSIVEIVGDVQVSRVVADAGVDPDPRWWIEVAPAVAGIVVDGGF